MAAVQTRDVLNRAREFHRLLGDFYHRLSDQVEKERIKLLLDYMSRHEGHLERALQSVQEDAASHVLETWFKHIPEIAGRRDLDEVTVRPDMTIEEVIQLGLKFDNQLVDLYRRLEESAVSDEVKALFKNLLEMEEHEELVLVRNALGYEQL